jgi:hypothetical protein
MEIWSITWHGDWSDRGTEKFSTKGKALKHIDSVKDETLIVWLTPNQTIANIKYYNVVIATLIKQEGRELLLRSASSFLKALQRIRKLLDCEMEFEELQKKRWEAVDLAKDATKDFPALGD